ncbi:diguanylate cyclase [Candidatus Aerophobetes bacterium]|uniref:Diguanylate cyclase n=1 Tax=Aerophobetes bacterium TaxID=2030807 RepID=A0A523QKR1_UNCAE|nr:MAG: diguanylate cyclase [Candidatus Aerophobetes bacterium]
MAFLMVDINRFKEINDRFGHHMRRSAHVHGQGKAGNSR